MTFVVDASAVVAGLIDSGQVGRWAEERLAEDAVAVPQLMTVEAANILRRTELAGDISADTASLAYADLLDLTVDLFSFEPFAERVWELRNSVTAYDAWYVALAESMETYMVTLDSRLSNAPGPRCEFKLPPRVPR